ncbi:MAG: transglycosylase SLT domain-containing protein [Deltaproteobacteria bacterium]|nr:transglycosylase SLT domain-containing protein [Deltaproteobacteria bacterium]
MTQVLSACLVLAALLGAPGLGPPRPVFDPVPGPVLSPAAPPEAPGPRYPTIHARRSEVYDRAVLFISQERFAEALALIRKQPRDIREWPGVRVLEAGLLSVSRPAEALDIYYRIINQKVRDRHWARAMAGYRLVLGRLSSGGDYGARARLIRSLGLEWRNDEARAILEATLQESGLPGEIRDELLAFRAVLALRVGDFATAGDFWRGRRDQASLRWLSTLRLREGKFTEAAEARMRVAGTAKGAQRLRELDRALDIMAKGGLSVQAEELLDKNKDLKRKAPDWNYRLGLANLLDGKPEKALGFFEAEAARKGGRAKPSLYFRARALEMLERPAEALEAYRLCAAGPMGYYRLLAEGRLASLSGLKGRLALAEPMASLMSDTLDDRDTMGYFLWLSERLPWPWPELGADAPARQLAPQPLDRARLAVDHYLAQGDLRAAYGELAAVGEAIVPFRKAEGDAAGSRYVLLAAQAGDYRLAVALMNRMGPPASSGGSRWSHPLVYGRPVMRAWRAHGLSPQLVLSVIRTESAFQAEVVSSSNARGLMQILPSTAMRIAALEGDGVPREEDLFDPELNIRYGTAYLSRLIGAFGNQPLALAAYNGGPFNVKAYMEALPQRPLDLFIETLPFAESANYVMRVTESLALYESAYLGRYGLADLTGPVGLPRGEPPGF